MAIREIITVPNPLLKKVSETVDNINDEVLAILEDMLETMYVAPGIGLAATNWSSKKGNCNRPVKRRGKKTTLFC